MICKELQGTKRVCPTGNAFNLFSRSVARLTLFEKPDAYATFRRVVEET